MPKLRRAYPVESTVNDKPIPLDPEPRADGNLAFRDDGKIYHVGKATEGTLRFDGMAYYVSHFATCPNANEHRKTSAP